MECPVILSPQVQRLCAVKSGFHEYGQWPCVLDLRTKLTVGSIIADKEIRRLNGLVRLTQLDTVQHLLTELLPCV